MTIRSFIVCVLAVALLSVAAEAQAGRGGRGGARGGDERGVSHTERERILEQRTSGQRHAAHRQRHRARHGGGGRP